MFRGRTGTTSKDLPEPATKRIKRNFDQPVTPNHIILHETTGNLDYHFSDLKTADTFLAQLRSHSRELNEKLIPPKHSSFCTHDNNTCTSVELTPTQFDAWLGNKRHDELTRLVKAIKAFKEEDDEKLDYLLSSNSDVLNQLALVIIDHNDALFSYVARCPSNIFIKILNKIRSEVLNKAALINIKKDGNPFSVIASHQIVYFRAFTEQLTDETLNQALLLSDMGDYTSDLRTILHRQPNETTNYVLNRLPKQTLETIFRSVLLSDNHFFSFNDFRKIKNYQLYLSNLPTTSRIRLFLAIDSMAACFYRHARYLPDVIYFRLMNDVFEHPAIAKQVMAGQEQLLSMEIYDGGSSNDAWSGYTKEILRRAPVIPTWRPKSYWQRNQSIHFAINREIDLNEYKVSSNLLTDCEKLGWQFLRLQGRTILLQQGEDILAIKIQKSNESYKELIKEYATTKTLVEQKSKLNLQSQFPTPQSLYLLLQNLFDWLKPHVSHKELEQFHTMVGDREQYYVYTYTANKDYFIYIHDDSLSEEASRQANRVAVNDLYHLFCNGIVFHQTADIFHNLEHTEEREDAGRYMVLVNVLRDFWRKGAGRLTGWKKAVEYPNIRASGLADVGDHISTSELNYGSNMVNKFFKETQKLYQDRVGNYIFANTLAEYQYILFLNAGLRACKLDIAAKRKRLSNEAIFAVWQRAAEQVINNCAQGAAILTKQPEEKIKEILLVFVNADRLARQMQFWMTREYISSMKKSMVPDDIYGHNVEVDINFNGVRANTFSFIHGCSIDGKNEDLGTVNGQEPIKEMNKLLYWMINYIFVQYHNLRMTVNDIKSVAREPDLNQSETNREQGFFHLPKKDYHRIQRDLCVERLKHLERTMYSLPGVEQQAAEHNKRFAVAYVASMWQEKKARREMAKVEAEKNAILHH